MKFLKLNLLLIIFFSTLTCSRNDSKPVIITAGVSSASGLQGGVIFYADDGVDKYTYVFQDGVEFENFQLTLSESSNWSFRVFSWEGPNKFEGSIRCGVVENFNTGTGNSTLAIDLTNSNCFNDLQTAGLGVMTDTANASFSAFKPLRLISCSTFDGISNVSDASNVSTGKCLKDSYYFGESFSYKVSVSTVSIAENAGSSSTLTSQCIAIPAGDSTSPRDVLANFNLPLKYNSTINELNYAISFYQKSDCTGEEKGRKVSNGLIQGNRTTNFDWTWDILGHDDTVSNQLTVVIIDSISGRRYSVFDPSMIPQTVCNDTTNDVSCVPKANPFTGIDFVISRGNVNVYLSPYDDCTGSNYNFDFTTINGSGSSGVPTGASIQNIDGTDYCNLSFSAQTVSSFTYTGNTGVLTKTGGSTVHGSSWSIWLTEDSELHVQDTISTFFGHPTGVEVYETKDGIQNNDSDDSQEHEKGIWGELAELVGPPIFGGILYSQLEKEGITSPSCGNLQVGYETPVYTIESDEGPMTVQLKIENSTMAIPDFICDDDNISKTSVTCNYLANFDKAMIAVIDGSRQYAYHFFCGSNIGKIISHETEDNETDTEELVWNSNQGYERLEIYEYESKGGSFDEAYYGRFVMTNSARNQFGVWTSRIAIEEGTPSYPESQQMHVIADLSSGEAYKVQADYRFMQDSSDGSPNDGNLDQYALLDVTPLTKWDDTTGDGFYGSTASGDPDDGVNGSCFSPSSMQTDTGCSVPTTASGSTTDDYTTGTYHKPAIFESGSDEWVIMNLGYLRDIDTKFSSP